MKQVWHKSFPQIQTNRVNLTQGDVVPKPDLSERPNEAPKPTATGFRSGRKFLLDYLHAYQDVGVNHMMFSLKHGSRSAEEGIQELGEYVLPHFPTIIK